MPAHRIPALTATHIRLLQAGDGDAALVQHADGSLDVIPSLRAEALPDSTVPLREHGRHWADALVAAQVKAATVAGTPTHVGTMRKLAAAVATAQVRKAADDEDAAEARAAARPTVRPVLPQQRSTGRHAALLTPAARELEEEAYALLVLDVLEAMDAP